MSENISLLEAMYSPYANIKTLKDAIEIAVEIKHGMEIENKWDSIKYPVDMPINPDKDNTYCTYAGTISFNYKGKKYELPYSEHIENALDADGFEVDFDGHTYASDGWYPVEKKEYWERLEKINNIMGQMRKVQENEKRKQIFINYCKDKGIKPLAEEYRDRCFKIPDNGYTIIGKDGKEIQDTKPGIFNMVVATAKIDYIGKISEFVAGHSGIYGFFDVDGTYYITKSEETINHLLTNGFTVSKKVPLIALGWNEYYQDPNVQAQYERAVVDDESYYIRVRIEKARLLRIQNDVGVYPDKDETTHKHTM